MIDDDGGIRHVEGEIYCLDRKRVAGHRLVVQLALQSQLAVGVDCESSQFVAAGDGQDHQIAVGIGHRKISDARPIAGIFGDVEGVIVRAKDRCAAQQCAVFQAIDNGKLRKEARPKLPAGAAGEVGSTGLPAQAFLLNPL